MVERGVMMLRLIPTAHHREEDVAYTLDAFEQIRAKIERGVYKNPDFAAQLPLLV